MKFHVNKTTLFAREFCLRCFRINRSRCLLIYDCVTHNSTTDAHFSPRFSERNSAISTGQSAKKIRMPDTNKALLQLTNLFLCESRFLPDPPSVALKLKTLLSPSRIIHYFDFTHRSVFRQKFKL